MGKMDTDVDCSAEPQWTDLLLRRTWYWFVHAQVWQSDVTASRAKSCALVVISKFHNACMVGVHQPSSGLRRDAMPGAELIRHTCAGEFTDDLDIGGGLQCLSLQC